jgi:hypothetical protein
MTRRIIATVALAMFCMLAAPLPAQAFSTFNPGGTNCAGDKASTAACSASSANPISGQDGLIIKISGIVSFVAGGLAVIMIVYGAIKYVTANGEASNIQSAKNTIIYSLVGLACIILVQTIINFVILKL